MKAVQQLEAPGHVSTQSLVCNALTTWLDKAVDAAAASPESRAVAMVQQQLQESQLLQHMGPGMDAAAARLTASLATLAALADTAAVPSHSSSSRADATTTAQQAIQDQLAYCFLEAEGCCFELQTFFKTACLLSPATLFSLAAALPAAPAAVKLCLTCFQACDSYTQLQQQLQPVRADRSQPHFDLRSMCSVTGALTAAVERNTPDMLLACPDTRKLLLMPEFASCIAVLAVAAALGQDSSKSGGPTGPAATPGSSSSGHGAGSSTGGHLPGAGRRRQRQQQEADGSSSSTGSGRLGSLTPLSCSVLDMLGVTKETVLQVAMLEASEGSAALPRLSALTAACTDMLAYQVSGSAKHTVNLHTACCLRTDALCLWQLLGLLRHCASHVCHVC
jgi:hypothetical protein